MIKFIFIFFLFVFDLQAQYQEAYITRTTSTNSVFPRQFPSMTIRKMSEKEYWIFDSLNTNTIFHRQFPTYIIRKQNFNTSQNWAVYRTTSTNSIFPAQFPDRYISDFNISNNYSKDSIYEKVKYTILKLDSKNSEVQYETQTQNNSYTYSRSLRKDSKSSYSGD